MSAALHTTSCTVGTQTSMSLGTMLTLSPKTCHELAPQLSQAQIDHEIFWRETTLECPVEFRMRKPNFDAKLAGIYKAMTSNISCELNELYYDCNVYQAITSDFSRLVDNAYSCIEEIVRRASATNTKTSATHIETETFFDSTEEPVRENQVPEPPQLPDPVRFLHLNVGGGLDVNTILKGVQLKRVGSRLVGHVGPVEYRYGNTRHPSCPYPENPVIDAIFDAISEHMKDPSINKSNYSTLFTMYRNGSDHLGFHSDDELAIDPDSDIITVSFGSTRDLEFRSIKGNVIRQIHSLPHGSVHVMSASSQAYWEHRIPTSDSTGQRVSMTIRKLTVIPPPVIPPIREPAHPPPPPPPEDCLPANPKRVLFLTDSIHSSLNTDIFPDPSKIECIKKINFELHNIHRFEQEFAYTDVVVLSCGINDFSRIGDQWDAANLFSFMRNKLRDYRVKYPNTWFIFNSLLLTRFDWVNRQVIKFNDMMFEFTLECRDISKVLFFDSSHIVHSLWLEGALIIDPARNGVHITHWAKNSVVSSMLRCVTELLADSPNLQRSWPLRRRFRDIAAMHC